jgi:hypothetical protein
MNIDEALEQATEEKHKQVVKILKDGPKHTYTFVKKFMGYDDVSLQYEIDAYNYAEALELFRTYCKHNNFTHLCQQAQEIEEQTRTKEIQDDIKRDKKGGYVKFKKYYGHDDNKAVLEDYEILDVQLNDIRCSRVNITGHYDDDDAYYVDYNKLKKGELEKYKHLGFEFNA